MAAAAPPARELKTDPKYDHYDFPTTSATQQSGHPGFTTEEQDAKVFQLRSMLEQEGFKERLDTLTMVRLLLLSLLYKRPPLILSCSSASCARASSTSRPRSSCGSAYRLQATRH